MSPPATVGRRWSGTAAGRHGTLQDIQAKNAEARRLAEAAAACLAAGRPLDGHGSLQRARGIWTDRRYFAADDAAVRRAESKRH